MSTLAKLVRMRNDIYSRIEADLETGSHAGNNAAWDKFSEDHPRLIRWLTGFCDFVDGEVEDVDRETK